MSRTTRNYPDWDGLANYRDDHQWSTPDPFSLILRSERKASRRTAKVALLDWEAEYKDPADVEYVPEIVYYAPSLIWADEPYDEGEDLLPFSDPSETA